MLEEVHLDCPQSWIFLTCSEVRCQDWDDEPSTWPCVKSFYLKAGKRTKSTFINPALPHPPDYNDGHMVIPSKFLEYILARVVDEQVTYMNWVRTYFL